MSGLPVVSTEALHPTSLPARLSGLPPVGAEVAMTLPAQVSAHARPALLSHCLPETRLRRGAGTSARRPREGAVAEGAVDS
jgi:hypothetical protein